MKIRPLSLGAGVALFLAGGVILALGGGNSGTALGTTVALAGLVLVGWTVLAGPRRSE
ncbi:MAG: hypothetical protein ACYTJ0_20950 [Planctomycetota bacterium]|jgi:hypothetical protein